MLTVPATIPVPVRLPSAVIVSVVETTLFSVPAVPAPLRDSVPEIADLFRSKALSVPVVSPLPREK